MDLSYDVTDLPALWPGKPMPYGNRKKAPFKATWTKTLHMLAREVRYLGGRKAELALDIRVGDLRQDGKLRADARPKTSSVIFSFLDRDGQRQAYPCDRFGWWQDNLYAIAVVLEDLRRAERYGVQSALLRAGFKALPAPASSTALSQSDAAVVVAQHSDSSAFMITTNEGEAKSAVRTALFRTHPDRNNGTRDNYDRVDAARKVLSAHHGVSL